MLVVITNSVDGTEIVGFADQVGSSTLFEFTPAASLADAAYVVTAALLIVDGGSPNMMDFGPLSEPHDARNMSPPERSRVAVQRADRD